MKPTRPAGVADSATRKDEPNNLLDFMLHLGPRTKHLLLGTATPIQTQVSEVWDLMSILNSGTDFVLGRPPLSNWTDWRRALPVVRGGEIPADERCLLGVASQSTASRRRGSKLRQLASATGHLRQFVLHGQGIRFAWILRAASLTGHTWPPVSTGNTIPSSGIRFCAAARRWKRPGCWSQRRYPSTRTRTRALHYPGVGFDGLGLRTNHPFDLAYQAAEAFTAALQKRKQGAGFMRTLAAPADLFQLCVRPFHRREASARRCSRRGRGRKTISPTPWRT